MGVKQCPGGRGAGRGGVARGGGGRARRLVARARRRGRAFHEGAVVLRCCAGRTTGETNTIS